MNLLRTAERVNILPSGPALYGEIVESHIRELQLDSIGDQTERDMLLELIIIIKDLLNEKKDRSNLESEIGVICGEMMEYGEDIIGSLCPLSYNGDESTKYIKNNLKQIKNEITENDVDELLGRASSDWRFKRHTIKNPTAFLTELTQSLANKIEVGNGKHAAEIDGFFGDDLNKIEEIIEEAKQLLGSSRVLKTGWQALNSMLQGGIRQGEFIVIPALQHSYKTSGTITLFKQLLMYNKPHTDNDKKKMMIRLSFEDSLAHNLTFLYINIIFNETNEVPVMEDVPTDVIVKKISDTLGVHGWHYIFKRLNGPQYSYLDILDLVNTLESRGYEIALVMVDYLLKLSLDGVRKDGPNGSPQRDLFEKTRDSFAAKNISFITPAQLGPRAKAITSTGIMPKEFLGRVAGQGMTSGSSQIDQVVDVCWYWHKIKIGQVTYLHTLKDKHRLPTVCAPKHDQYFMEFPEIGPIKDDINDKVPSHIYSLDNLDGGDINEEASDSVAALFA